MTAFSASCVAPRSQRIVVEFEEYCSSLDVWLECRACPREGGARYLPSRYHRTTPPRRRPPVGASPRRSARHRRPRFPQSPEHDSRLVEGRARDERSQPAQANRDDRTRFGADGTADSGLARRERHRVRHARHRPRGRPAARGPCRGHRRPRGRRGRAGHQARRGLRRGPARGRGGLSANASGARATCSGTPSSSRPRGGQDRRRRRRER